MNFYSDQNNIKCTGWIRPKIYISTQALILTRVILWKGIYVAYYIFDENNRIELL